MQMSYDVFFVSSNRNKYTEAKKILSTFGIKLGLFRISIEEIQDESIKKIASSKVLFAFKKFKKPIIIEDDGLFIESLKGFPGPYSSYVFNTIGNNGILKLVKTNRNAFFQSVIAYCDKQNGIILFDAMVKGKISKKLQGSGWGFDPIFIPKGQSKPYALLSDKNKISHRYLALKKFSSWFTHMQKSFYQ